MRLGTCRKTRRSGKQLGINQMSNSKQSKARTVSNPVQKWIGPNKVDIRTVAFYAAFCRTDLSSAELKRVDAFIGAAFNSHRYSEQVRLTDILRKSQSLVDIPEQQVVWTETELKEQSDKSITHFD
jgi:hypothetical protein